MKTSQFTLANLLLVERLEALRTAPGLGPSLLFFSGGTALRPLCRKLKLYTHNSVHVITPFDSGGSSAEIRRAFAMLSVGDLRNRMLALADETHHGNGSIYRLFSYRLPKQQPQASLQAELAILAKGTHPLTETLPAPVRPLVCDTLRFVGEKLPADFNLEGANIGNLVLTGVYLSHDREVETALLLLGKMLGVHGTVLPSAEADAQLAVRLRGGSVVVGQHRITGKEVAPLSEPIDLLYLTRDLQSQEPIAVSASSSALRQIAEADLICFPYGSFYSSVLANLLPSGVGSAITNTRCPKVYVPNWGNDPEQVGMTLGDTVERLIEAVRREAPTAGVRDIVQRVLIDRENLSYSLSLDTARVEQMGIEVLDLPFAERRGSELDFTRLAELLISLS